MCVQCALHCAQLLHTVLHRTDLIIFPLTLQTVIIAPMTSTNNEVHNAFCYEVTGTLLI